MSAMVARLVVKDLFFNRSLIAGAIVAGYGAIFLMGAAPLPGMITFVTVVVVTAVFIGMVGVTRERAEKSALFELSLPVSTMQYTMAKVLGAAVSFLIPWSVLLASVLALNRLAPEPPPSEPFFISLMTLLLTNFFVLVSVGIVTTSERWTAGTIILTNLSVPLFFARSSPEDMPSGWSSGMLVGFAIEAAIVLLCLGTMFLVQSRRRDFH